MTDSLLTTCPDAPAADKSPEAGASARRKNAGTSISTNYRKRQALKNRLKALVGDNPSCVVQDRDGKLHYADHALEVVEVERDLREATPIPAPSATLPGLHAHAAFLWACAENSVSEIPTDCLDFDLADIGSVEVPALDDLLALRDQLDLAIGDLTGLHAVVEKMLDLAPPEADSTAQPDMAHEG